MPELAGNSAAAGDMDPDTGSGSESGSEHGRGVAVEPRTAKHEPRTAN